MTPATWAALALLPAAFWWRIGFGGLLRKWQAHALAPLMSLPFWLALPWPVALVMTLATGVQFFSPGRDFARGGSLLEAHGPWAAVGALAVGAPWPFLGVFGVVGAYHWATRRAAPRAGFWQPTVIAEGLTGLSVYASAYAGALLGTPHEGLVLVGEWLATRL